MKVLDYAGVQKLWQKIKFELSKKGKIDTLAAADKSIVVAGTEMNPTVQVQLSQAQGNNLQLKSDGLYAITPINAEYSIAAITPTNNNVLASYSLQKDGQNVGSVINIPKDKAILSGAIEKTQNGIFLHLVINNAENPNLYIPVDDLVEYVSSGSGVNDVIQIAVDANHEVSAAILDGGITKIKLAQSIQDSLDAADNALQASDVGSAAYASADAFDGAGAAQTVANTLSSVATSGDYNDLLNKPSIPIVPTNVSEFNNDAGYLTSFTETDPTVPAWAKATNKPSYTASEVGALPDNTTYVSSFNGDTGDIIYEAPVTSVNGQTGNVVLSIPVPQVQSDWNASSGMGQILNKPVNVSAFNNDAGYLTEHQDISGKAPLASPALTGTPTAPTATAGTSTNQLATTAFVQEAVGNASSGLVKRSIVQTLPQSDIDNNTIYMIPKITPELDNAYNEFMYINNNWELIGSTEVDLSNYLQDSDIAAWAKAATKPAYTANEVGALPANTSIPSDVSDLTDNNNLLFSGDYTDLTNIPEDKIFPVVVSLISTTNGSSDKSHTEIAAAVTAGKIPFVYITFGSIKMIAPLARVESNYAVFVYQDQTVTDHMNYANLKIQGISVVITWRDKYVTLSDIPADVSAFRNDAGYLVEHQDISGKAPIASPNFTGTPTAPTPSSGNDSTQLATTEFVNDAIQTALGDIETLLGAL